MNKLTTNSICWKQVSESEEVIILIKQIKAIEEKVFAIDPLALIKYELEKLKQEDSSY